MDCEYHFALTQRAKQDDQTECQDISEMSWEMKSRRDADE